MRAAIFVGFLTTLFSSTAGGVELRWSEGDVRAFPALFDTAGKLIAEGEYIQQRRGDDLLITSKYKFTDGRRTEEHARLVLRPQIVQKSWSFEEKREGKVVRRFEVDLTTGLAKWMKMEDGEKKSGDEELDITPGKTFAGIGFSTPVKNLRAELKKGVEHTLEAVAFTPKPRKVEVEISRFGDETLSAGKRRVEGERFKVHPKLPFFAKPFVDAPDTFFWYTPGDPPALLRVQTTIAEPDDPTIVMNLFGNAASIEQRASK